MDGDLLLECLVRLNLPQWSCLLLLRLPGKWIWWPRRDAWWVVLLWWHLELYCGATVGLPIFGYCTSHCCWMRVPECCGSLWIAESSLRVRHGGLGTKVLDQWFHEPLRLWFEDLVLWYWCNVGRTGQCLVANGLLMANLAGKASWMRCVCSGWIWWSRLISS